MPALPINKQGWRQQHLDELHEKIANIVEYWQCLSENEWNQPAAEELFLSIQALTATSEHLGLIQISEAIFSIEVYLSSFIDSGLRPNDEQLQEANRFIKALQTIGDNLPPPETIDDSIIDEPLLPSQSSQHIYYIRTENDIAPTLVPVLKERGCSVLTFVDADDLLAEFNKVPPQVLIFDIHFLPSLKPVVDIIRHRNKENKQQVNLVCLSHSNSFKLSLQPARCGVEAYYAPPFEIGKISQKIIDMVGPTDSQSYRVADVEDNQAQAGLDSETIQSTDRHMPEAHDIELTATIQTENAYATTPHVGVRPFVSDIYGCSEMINEESQIIGQAKKTGDNEVVDHRPDGVEPMDEASQNSLITPLQEAIRDESFQIVSQIFINRTENDRIKQLALTLPTEADTLHDEDEFLPVAREAGVIEDIDKLITRQALSLLNYHRYQGQSANILIRQNRESFVDRGRINWLREQLRDYQLVGTGLIIGFNLSTLARHLVSARRYIEALHAMGIAVALLEVKPNSSTLKAMRFLSVEYVVISRIHLGLDRKAMEEFMQHAHSFHTQVVIPPVDSLSISTQHWLQVADYYQKGSSP